MGDRSALEIAIDLFHRPIAVRDYRHAPLPRDVLTVIRIAAGSEIETSKFGPDQTRRAREIREACGFYVQQILFHTKADPYRMLGLAPGAEPRLVQDHKRMLLKWLHPDRNPNKWEQALFQRVIQAAAHIENNELGAVPIQTRPRIKEGALRAHHGLPLQRVPIKGHWRTKLYRYMKRGVLILSFTILTVGTAVFAKGGNVLDLSDWQNLVDVAWFN